MLGRRLIARTFSACLIFADDGESATEDNGEIDDRSSWDELFDCG